MTAHPSPVDVTTAGPGRCAEVVDVLAAAFVDDPIMAWMLPDPTTRPAALRRLFTLDARHRALALGACAIARDDTGPVGATLAFPPGHATASSWFQVRHALGYLRVFGANLARAGRVQQAMARVHPTVPHVYLYAIGVRPDRQGRGVATAMLAPTLQRCDGEGLPAYLEASSPGSARLYRRLGFVGDELLTVEGADDFPPVVRMTRPPA